MIYQLKDASRLKQHVRRTKTERSVFLCVDMVDVGGGPGEGGVILVAVAVAVFGDDICYTMIM